MYPAMSANAPDIGNDQRFTESGSDNISIIPLIHIDEVSIIDDVLQKLESINASVTNDISSATGSTVTVNKPAPKTNIKRSKNGCMSCKKMKIKCDEVKPACEYCRHTKRNCVYSQNSNWKVIPISTLEEEQLPLRTNNYKT